MLFEVWVEGTHGIHKGKPVLYTIHSNYAGAQMVMNRFLKNGKFATIITKKEEKKRILLTR